MSDVIHIARLGNGATSWLSFEKEKWDKLDGIWERRVAVLIPESAPHVGSSAFEGWFSEFNPAGKGTKQQMREAYAAGMNDPLVAVRRAVFTEPPHPDMVAQQVAALLQHACARELAEFELQAVRQTCQLIMVASKEPSAQQGGLTPLQVATSGHDPDTPMACYADAMAEQQSAAKTIYCKCENPDPEGGYCQNCGEVERPKVQMPRDPAGERLARWSAGRLTDAERAHLMALYEQPAHAQSLESPMKAVADALKRKAEAESFANWKARRSSASESGVAEAQPSELEMHRADYQAVKAAGFEDPGELLAAYQALKRRHDGLRKLCGHVENGSDTTVKLFQDDATREWCVKVGERSYYAGSLNGALDCAIEDNKDDE